MTYIDKNIKESVLVKGLSDEMLKNGWKAIHYFTKLGIDPTMFETKVETLESSPAGMSWDIPEGLNIENFQIYFSLDGSKLQILTSDEYTVNANTRTLKVTKITGPGQELIVYIYYPSKGISLSPPPAGGGLNVGPYFECHYGEHVILENNSVTWLNRQSLYGMAEYSKIRVPFSYVGDVLPFIAPVPEDPSRSHIVDATGFLVKVQEIKDKHKGFKKPSIYTYMLDKYDNPDSTLIPDRPVPSHHYTLVLSGDGKQNVLDAEIFGTEWLSTVQGQPAISRPSTKYATNIQSPIIESDYRHEELGYAEYSEKFDEVLTVGNFWPDSNVRVKGYIDERTTSLVLHSDTAPSFDMNAVPIIPIYLGEGQDLKGYEQTETDDKSLLDVLYGGTVPKVALNMVPKFDFDDTSLMKFTKPITPIMREQNDSQGNGLDNVIVRRNKNGARYVGHYISTATAPNMMPPNRVHDVNGLKYPRAWQQPTNNEYNYKFNPSVSSKKVTTGEAYIMHGEEGMRGVLRNLVLCNPLSILNGDKIKVTNDFCATPSGDAGSEEYVYHLVEGISPFTKRPSVHYRPMGLSILFRPDPNQTV